MRNLGPARWTDLRAQEVVGMHEIFLTVTGNVASRPKASLTSTGHSVTSFRLASTPRRFNKSRGEWVDGPTAWFAVSCWRGLADHVASSLSLGDPVVVHGRLEVKEFTRGDGVPGTSLDLQAHTVGHDLSRGTSMFRRRSRGDAASTQAAHDGAGATPGSTPSVTEGAVAEQDGRPPGSTQAA
jgi:single-strand DNA-binding protein